MTIKNIEEKFDKIPYWKLKTQEEKWTCDAGCGVDKEAIKNFYSKEIKELIEEIIPEEKEYHSSNIIADPGDALQMTQNSGYNLCIKDIKSKLPWRN